MIDTSFMNWNLISLRSVVLDGWCISKYQAPKSPWDCTGLYQSVPILYFYIEVFWKCINSECLHLMFCQYYFLKFFVCLFFWPPTRIEKKFQYYDQAALLQVVLTGRVKLFLGASVCFCFVLIIFFYLVFVWKLKVRYIIAVWAISFFEVTFLTI